MANERHLHLLARGVKAWNSWREDDGFWVTPDLSEARLVEANLSGAYLAGAYLSEADLSGADLSGADLTRLV
jgi:hypothetical protein